MEAIRSPRPVARGGMRKRARPVFKRVLGEHPTAWGFVGPSALLILGFAFVPMAWSFLLSLKSSDLLTPGEWVGLRNYDQLADNPAFRDAIEHTLVLTALFVPLSVAGGLALALALNRPVRFVALYRTCVFIPFIISAAAQGVLFAFVFDPHFGIANTALHGLGIERQGFLQDPGQALYVLVAVALWSGVGFCVVVYLAGLQDIPKDLYEAAALDGARRWATFRHVTLPLLRPITIFLVVWQTFTAFQLFDLVYAATRGGPLDATVVVVYFVYQQAFELFRAGYGAAAAYLLAVAILLVGAAGALARRLRERPA